MLANGIQVSNKTTQHLAHIWPWCLHLHIPNFSERTCSSIFRVVLYYFNTIYVICAFAFILDKGILTNYLQCQLTTLVSFLNFSVQYKVLKWHSGVVCVKPSVTEQLSGDLLSDVKLLSVLRSAHHNHCHCCHYLPIFHSNYDVSHKNVLRFWQKTSF